jgi:DNA-binding NtrC family response regulator
VNAATIDGSTVLVVDDDAAVRESVCEVLGSAGFSPISAGDGREALSIMGDTKVDAILLDLFMPDVSGTDVLEALEPDNPVVVVFSAFEYMTLRDVKARHGSRVCAFVSKPAPPAQLVRTVARCLGADA